MLYHFSDRPDIRCFRPRPSRLGHPVVWAIEPKYAFLYLFPRDCPRILVWATAQSRAVDRHRWLQGAARVAFVEQRWLTRITHCKLYRYAFRITYFQSLDDAGMHISDASVRPRCVMPVNDLPHALRREGVVLRALPSLVPLKPIWNTSLHASGIRLRNAVDWN
ncbi:MAG: DUF6886 family protein [Pseudomonadota bacterium]